MHFFISNFKRFLLGALPVMLLWPAFAEACAVCFFGDGKSMMAYYKITIALSALPISLFLGFLIWMKKKSN